MDFLKKKTKIEIIVEHDYEDITDLMREISNQVNMNNNKMIKKDSFGRVILDGDITMETRENPQILDLNKSNKREFKTLIDMECTDNDFNSPKKEILKQGTIIIISDGNNRGDIFATTSEGKRIIINNKNAIISRYPYHKGILNLNYFKVI